MNRKYQARSNADKSKQKSTLILSGGEQTINFNLTQEDDENESIDNKDLPSDEDLDVGEEIPAENTNKLNLNLPESKIL